MIKLYQNYRNFFILSIILHWKIFCTFDLQIQWGSEYRTMDRASDYQTIWIMDKLVWTTIDGGQNGYHLNTGPVFRCLKQDGSQKCLTIWKPVPYSDDWFSGTSHLNNAFQFVWYSKDYGSKIQYSVFRSPLWIQWPCENWTIWYSNGHFLDTICIQFLNGY
jgi:hypothetical protein